MKCFREIDECVNGCSQEEAAQILQTIQPRKTVVRVHPEETCVNENVESNEYDESNEYVESNENVESNEYFENNENVESNEYYESNEYFESNENVESNGEQDDETELQILKVQNERYKQVVDHYQSETCKDSLRLLVTNDKFSGAITGLQEEFKTKIKVLEEKLEHLQKELDDSHKKLKETESSSSQEIKKLESTISGLRSKSQATTDELKECKKVLSDLRKKERELISKNEVLTIENKTLEQSYAGLKSLTSDTSFFANLIKTITSATNSATSDPSPATGQASSSSSINKNSASSSSSKHKDKVSESRSSTSSRKSDTTKKQVEFVSTPSRKKSTDGSFECFKSPTPYKKTKTNEGRWVDNKRREYIEESKEDNSRTRKTKTVAQKKIHEDLRRENLSNTEDASDLSD